MNCQEGLRSHREGLGGLVVLWQVAQELLRELQYEDSRDKEGGVEGERQGQRDSGTGMSCRAYETVASPCWGLGRAEGQ